MKLREEILQEHSKKQILRIAEWIDSDEKRFDQLMHLFLHDEYRVVQRSAWIVSTCAEQYPSLINPYLKQMIAYCHNKHVHPAVKRNVTKVIAHIDIPESVHADAMNLCFELLSNVHEAIAIRCWSMEILRRLSKEYPEIKNELRQMIENSLEYENLSAGFLSKSKRVLKEIKSK